MRVPETMAPPIPYNSTSCTNSPETSLPNIAIKSFNGDFKQWVLTKGIDS